jgi:hypothetical protein
VFIFVLQVDDEVHEINPNDVVKNSDLDEENDQNNSIEHFPGYFLASTLKICLNCFHILFFT